MNIQAAEVTGVFPIAGDKGYNIKLNNGNKYALWGDNAPRPCNNGDLVSFDYTEKQNGSYTNRTIAKSGITVEGGNAPTASAPTPTAARPAPQAQAKPVDVQGMIVAQNCLGHAVKAIATFPDKFNIQQGNVTTTILAEAGVLARAVIAGDFYKDPEFDSALTLDMEK